MKFGDLKVKDFFILLNHIPTRDGIPSLQDVRALEVFRKIAPRPSGVNTARWRQKAKEANGAISDSAPVVKLK